MTIKQLSSALMEKRYKNSTVPEYARPVVRLSDKSANELTKTIVAYFEYKGIQAWRQSSEGRYLKGKEYTDWSGRKKEEKGMFIPRAHGAKGSADITATLPPLGRRLEIEVKFGKDRQSDVQKEFQRKVESMGGLYMIVRTWEEFVFQIEKI